MKHQIHSPSWKTWSLLIGIIATGFTALVLALTLQSRSTIRQQILDRDGHVLTAVAGMLQSTGDRLSRPDDLEIALLTSRLRGVLGVRLFDSNGDFILSVPLTVAEHEFDLTDTASLQAGQPVTRFHPKADLSRFFHSPPGPDGFTEKTSLQEVAIPLRQAGSGEVTGMVQYLIDGQPVQAEFAALDRTLLLQAGSALVLALGALILLAALAFARLRRAHQTLAQQTLQLIEVNKELSLAARTSAIGAVTSHLIHGIRNAITGIDFALQSRSPEGPSVESENWNELANATNKIRTLVDDVMEVLRAQDATSSFALTLEELEAVLRDKLQPKAEAEEVRLEIRRSGDGELPGHAANMILLILMNLVDNALSLTPKEKAVWVSVEQEDSHITFEVGDEGPGIPDDLQPHLFTPGRSGRPGGTGLGLAISHRLANNLNATLELARSDAAGTVLILRYPLEANAVLAPELSKASVERS